MLRYYVKGWLETLDINGKTNRKEFWSFVIIDILVVLLVFSYGALIHNIPVITDIKFLAFLLGILLIFSVFIIVPLAFVTRISILGRRIRDTGRDQKWMFCILIPFIGWLILILLALQPSFSGSRDALPVKFVKDLNEENSDKKTNNNSLQSKLEELKILKDKKLVSNKEYEELRKKILDL